MTGTDGWYRRHLTTICQQGEALRGDPLRDRWREGYRSLFAWLCVRQGVPDSEAVFAALWDNEPDAVAAAVQWLGILLN